MDPIAASRMLTRGYEFALNWIRRRTCTFKERSSIGVAGKDGKTESVRVVCKRPDGVAVSATIRLGLPDCSRPYAHRGNARPVPKHGMGSAKHSRALPGLR